MSGLDEIQPICPECRSRGKSPREIVYKLHKGNVIARTTNFEESKYTDIRVVIYSGFDNPDAVITRVECGYCGYNMTESECLAAKKYLYKYKGVKSALRDEIDMLVHEGQRAARQQTESVLNISDRLPVYDNFVDTPLEGDEEQIVCRHCGMLTDDCSCELCEECGEYIEECTCEEDYEDDDYDEDD